MAKCCSPRKPLLKKKSNIFWKSILLSVNRAYSWTKIKQILWRSSRRAAILRSKILVLFICYSPSLLKPFKKRKEAHFSPQPSPSTTVARHQGKNCNAIGFLQWLCSMGRASRWSIFGHQRHWRAGDSRQRDAWGQKVEFK